MQRNFILTDVMKTGYHVDLEDFINMNSFEDQSFDMTGEYYTLHNYDLDSYDRRFAIIDCRIGLFICLTWCGGKVDWSWFSVPCASAVSINQVEIFLQNESR